MRLFVAIRLEGKMFKALENLQASFLRQGVSGNFVPAENLHITLAFIGEYSAPHAVLEAMEQLSFPAFELCMEGIGSFGDLWWTGFKESPALKKLAMDLRAALREAGIPYDKTKFKPHVTFLRKAKFPGHGLKAVGMERANMTVTGISLMRSTFGKNGMIYTELGRVDAE